MSHKETKYEMLTSDVWNLTTLMSTHVPILNPNHLVGEVEVWIVPISHKDTSYING